MEPIYVDQNGYNEILKEIHNQLEKAVKNIDVNYSENEKEKIVVEEVKEENKTEQLALETYKDSIFTRVKKWLLNIKEKIFK